MSGLAFPIFALVQNRGDLPPDVPFVELFAHPSGWGLYELAMESLNGTKVQSVSRQLNDLLIACEAYPPARALAMVDIRRMLQLYSQYDSPKNWLECFGTLVEQHLEEQRNRVHIYAKSTSTEDPEFPGGCYFWLIDGKQDDRYEVPDDERVYAVSSEFMLYCVPYRIFAIGSDDFRRLSSQKAQSVLENDKIVERLVAQVSS